MFLDCSWLKRTLDNSLDDILQAKDQEVIVDLVIKLLEYYAQKTTNDLDNIVVKFVKAKLSNETVPPEDVEALMKIILADLPDNKITDGIKMMAPIIEREILREVQPKTVQPKAQPAQKPPLPPKKSLTPPLAPQPSASSSGSNGNGKSTNVYDTLQFSTSQL